jgi:hypothetical protein
MQNLSQNGIHRPEGQSKADAFFVPLLFSLKSKETKAVSRRVKAVYTRFYQE